MNIGLTYDIQSDPSDERQVEFDTPETLEALTAALRDGGHQVFHLGSPLDLLARHAKLGGLDLVFNLAEGQGTRCREAWAPMLLELLELPYAGSDPLALMMGLDKVLCKQLAMAEGIPTPPWVAMSSLSELPAALPFKFPAIVKPRYEGSGRGIDAGAVVSDMAALRSRAAWLTGRCPGPILIEQFVDGGELTVCLIGNDPPMAYPAIQRAIDPASRLSCHVIRPAPESGLTPLQLTTELDRQAGRLSAKMFQVLGCRDVARVDFRVDRGGRLQFLEINPLPSFEPAGSFGLLAEYLGTTYAMLIGSIVQAALVRERASATAQMP